MSMFVNDKYPLPFNEDILLLRNILTLQEGKYFVKDPGTHNSE